MKIGLILPDNPGWRSDARAKNFTTALKSMGHTFDLYFVGRDCYPANLTQYDIVFNHALQSPPAVLRKVAEAHPLVNIVHVNHSSLAHIESSGERLINRLCETIHASRALRNVWVASVDNPSFQMAAGLERSLQLPIPLQDLEPRQRRTCSKKPVVVMAGRVDPVKNQINQLLACCEMGEEIELHLCLDPPAWMTNILHACGMKARSHGLLPHPKWIEFLQTKADIVLQCGLTESFNITACEAMQIGVPVIANNSIEFSDSFLRAAPNEASSIANSIRRTLFNYAVYSNAAIARGRMAAEATRELYKRGIEEIKEFGGAFHPRPLPKLKIDGEGPRAITVVAGDSASMSLLELTEPRMRAYADRIGAAFIKIQEQPIRGYPVGNKWLATQVAENYDRVLYLDCDVWISDTAPDIFSEVPAGKFGVVDETNVYGEEKVLQASSRLAFTQGMHPISRMVNGGVLIFDKWCSNLYAQPSRKAPHMHILDQLNLGLQLSATDSAHYLDPKFNWVFANRDFWQKAKDAHFVHFAGANPIEYRLQLLERFNSGEYTRLDPPDPSKVTFAANWLL